MDSPDHKDHAGHISTFKNLNFNGLCPDPNQPEPVPVLEPKPMPMPKPKPAVCGMLIIRLIKDLSN